MFTVEAIVNILGEESATLVVCVRLKLVSQQRALFSIHEMKVRAYWK